MVISSQDNRKVAAKSPFKIQRELVKILDAEPHRVTKQRSGDLMVELRSKEQERKLEKVKSFSILEDTDLILLNSKTPTFKHPAYHTT